MIKFYKDFSPIGSIEKENNIVNSNFFANDFLNNSN